MKRLARWIVGVSGFLAAPAAGLYAGSQAAFWHTYYFVDDDRTGNADLGTNFSYLVSLVLFGAIGFLVGLIACSALLIRLIGGGSHGRPDAGRVES
jgi:hypothetical protein